MFFLFFPVSAAQDAGRWWFGVFLFQWPRSLGAGGLVFFCFDGANWAPMFGVLVQWPRSLGAGGLGFLCSSGPGRWALVVLFFAVSVAQVAGRWCLFARRAEGPPANVAPCPLTSRSNRGWSEKRWTRFEVAFQAGSFGIKEDTVSSSRRPGRARPVSPGPIVAWVTASPQEFLGRSSYLGEARPWRSELALARPQSWLGSWGFPASTHRGPSEF